MRNLVPAPRARTTRSWVVFGALLAVLVLLSFILRLPDTTLTQPVATGNVGEITGVMEVGQVFLSTADHLRAVRLAMATYGGRANTEDVLFELRTTPDAPSALRSVRVNARAFRDREGYTFRFPPVREARGRHFYASLRSPSSRSGNAITVRYANGNPYAESPAASLYLWRAGRTAAGVAQAQKFHADLAFAVFHDVPAATLAQRRLTDWFAALRRDPARFQLLLLLGFASLAVASAVVPKVSALDGRLRGRALWILLSVLLLAGVAFRMLYAQRLPVTNDEGTALYDAWTVRAGRIPGGDGILKNPVTIGLTALGLAALGPTLSAGRLLSIVAGILSLLPLLVLYRRLSPHTSRFPLAVLWLFTAAPAVYSIYLHAQPLQLLLGLVGLAAFVTSLSLPKRRFSNALVAGAAFALAFGARKTSLAFALPALVSLFLIETASWRQRLRSLAATAGAFLVVFGFLTGLQWKLYGTPGVQYFLGAEVAKIDPATTASSEERRAAFVNGVLPIFREGLPLLLLALVALGGLLESVLRSLLRRPLLARGIWLLPVLLAVGATSFIRAYERPEHTAFGVLSWWSATPLLLALCALGPRGRRTGPAADGNSPLRADVQALLIPLAWIFGSALLYASWIKFTANYLAEFMPPLTLLAGSGIIWLSRAFRERATLLLLSFLVIAGIGYSAARSSYVFEHTGTFDRRSLEEAAAVLRAAVPRDEPILTAAVAIPVLSGHRVLFDVAHPTHYAYGFIEPAVRNIYMAPADQMVRSALTDVRWFVLERLTAFSYFREYPEIEEHVRRNFEEVAVIENLSNPITILRKR